MMRVLWRDRVLRLSIIKLIEHIIINRRSVSFVLDKYRFGALGSCSLSNEYRQFSSVGKNALNTGGTSKAGAYLKTVICKAMVPPAFSSSFNRYFNHESCVVYVPTAAEADIVESSVVNEIVEVYTLDGQRMDNLRGGINIVRMSDGTTKKVYVK